MIDFLAELFTVIALVSALIIVIVFWVIMLVGFVWPEIKFVYNYFKEQVNESSDPS